MFAPGIIVLERGTRWEAELKREAGATLQVRPCRRPADVLRELAMMRGSVVVVDLEVGAAECLRLLARVIEEVLRPQVVVVAAASQADLEWPARELGAVEFLLETGLERRLGLACLRLLERCPLAASSGAIARREQALR